MNRPSAADALREAVQAATPRLLALTEAEAGARPARGGWSRKELLGHLIDSASNNHQRFVRARFQDELVFPGYEQDEWVAAQRCGERPWRELVELWCSFNLHLAHVMETTPEGERLRPRARHNLHRIAWRKLPESEPATLEYFMHDYVGHLRHHLRQAGVD